MTRDTPYRALIVGDGPAALEAVLTLRELAPAVDVTLLAPATEYRYSPLSTTAPFARGEVRRYPLTRMADHGARVVPDALMRVEPDEHRVLTETGRRIDYDGLILATGAHRRRAVPRVLTFEGPGDVEGMHGLIRDVEDGYTRSVAFIAPPGAAWTLPLYELALQTAERAGDLGVDVDLTFVSGERRPLEVFGDQGSELAARLLDRAGITWRSGVERPVAGRTIALPEPVGRHLAGLPCDDQGFLPVDDHGRVSGVADVWAAGDGTDRQVKQGGLATQQAEVAARSLAAAAGEAVDPVPYEPVLRAILVAGRQVWYLVRGPGADAVTEVSEQPLWEPPTKIAGRRLGPFLDELDEITPRANRFERRVTALPAAPGQEG